MTFASDLENAMGLAEARAKLESRGADARQILADLKAMDDDFRAEDEAAARAIEERDELNPRDCPMCDGSGLGSYGRCYSCMGSGVRE